MEITAYLLAQRFIGTTEVKGETDNPQIMAMLKRNYRSGKALYDEWPEHDEVPWCSAFVNYVGDLLGLEVSTSLRARSWLSVGTAVGLDDAEKGFDIVVLKRGKGPQPGPEVIKAPGHVGFYAGHDDKFVYILGGNQGNKVSVRRYVRSRILGIRRLSPVMSTGGSF